MAQESFDQLLNAVKQAESRGQRYDKSGQLTTSPKGAQGEMQVMPGTQLDPGYGVAPAQDKSAAEIARVGKDYLSAMLGKYGNEQHALVAYNWGPGNADKWLASGANPAKLPAETQNYLQKVQEYKGSPLAGGSVPKKPAKVADVNLEDVGPGYKAAMAMMFLADDKPETTDEDIWKESEPEVAAEEAAPSPLAGLDLTYKSPFPVKQPTAAQQLAQLSAEPQAFAHGGVVHRADGSPETGELTPEEIEAASRPAFVTPKSGIGRKAGPISEALNTGTAYPAMARGVAETPYNVVGAPVDLVTMAMRPFGYKEEKPVMGSEWIKEKMTKYGIRPGEEANPTLQGFRTAAELGASVVNPGPVAAKVGQTAEKGIAAVARPIGEALNERMLRGESLIPGMSVQPPIMFAREPGKAAATGIFSHTPSNEAPFVGRLDEYISNLPGPVQKQQFFGQLKGKFRDYEIGRAEEALKDLPDSAKLTPSDLLNRVKGVYDPGRYKTTVINPSDETRGSFYQGMDNPYYDKPTGIGQPLGVIHMTMETTPELEATQNAAQTTMESFRRMMRSNADDNDMAAINSFLQSPKFNTLPNAQEMLEKFNTGMAQHGKIKAYMDEVSNVDNMLRYPTLSNEYNALADAAMDKYRGKMHWSEAYDKAKRDTHLALIEKANEWLKKNEYDPVDTRMLKNLPTGQSPADNEEFVQAARNALDPAEQMIRKADRNLSQFLKEPVFAVSNALSTDLPYTGQHTSLRGGNNPIAFSRFSEHTTELPGMGEVKGIYVNELQSDMLDDLRKAGKRGGNKEQDLALAQQLDKDISALQQKQKDALAAGKGPLAEDLDRQLMAAKQRKDIVSRRARMGTYDVPEIMAGMETSPQVVQQLMAKNAISAAIQRGDSFVAFPGKESAQAQLYEKLPHNLKQVVKDLGPGFEVRPIELEGPIGKMSHVGVVWGPEAAARLQKKGVPFAKGGLVDKVNADNRRYL